MMYLLIDKWSATVNISNVIKVCTPTPVNEVSYYHLIEINNINSAEVEGIRRSVSEKRIR